MEASKLGKARAGVFLLLIAISLYSLFMISASNTSYAAGQSLFKFSSLIGLSPSVNGYDRFKYVSNVSEKLISSVEEFKTPNSKKFAVALLDADEVASFLSSPSKSSFSRSRTVATGSSADKKDFRLAAGFLLLPFTNASASLDTGLISQCINSIEQDLVTGERDVDAVLACIYNNGAADLLADASSIGGTGNPVDPFDNNDPNGVGVAVNGSGGTVDGSGGTGNGGGAADGGGTGNDGSGAADGSDGAGNGTGNGSDAADGSDGITVLAVQVPEPSTYMLLGLGMITLVGFSRKKAKARIS